MNNNISVFCIPDLFELILKWKDIDIVVLDIQLLL